ncbi:MAG: hypothetical protein RJA34_2159 [Pseudomonadota bacterium]|jgi:diguanylate cyclase (GGDEF)-like protein
MTGARMNLRPRFILFTAMLFLVFAVPTWLAVRSLADGIVQQWALRYAEKQVRYDKSRTLQPILREVALSRQLAQSQYIRDWAHQPDDPELTRRAIAEMESFRLNFQDRSYFVALLKNGHYYHNNASNEFAGKQLRYVLYPSAEKDAWFYDLVRQGRSLHINVNPDENLGITKLWIDILIRDGEQILGMAGTGLDLTSFIRNVVEENVPGVNSLFVDHTGAIQMHRNQRLIDFSSISKVGRAQNTLELLLDRPADHAAVMSAMKSLESQADTVITLPVEMQGKRYLAGLAYLPEIDWYEITLLDLEVLLPFSEFTGIVLVYLLTLAGVLLLFNLALQHYVLRPLNKLDAAMASVEAGQAAPGQLELLGTGEIRGLMQRFSRMASVVMESRRDLESKVQARTLALDRLTKVDPLTDILNRRGMTECMQAEVERCARGQASMGILWLDVDHFKAINDRHGHALGDEVLVTIARLLQAELRAGDVASRWGGDEFLVMVTHVDRLALDRMGERLRQAVAQCQTVHNATGEPVPLSVSIGGYLCEPADDLNALLVKGDQALYAAKAAGRNSYRAFSDMQATT